MGHRNAVREAGRARGILQVRDVVRAGLGQFAVGCGALGEHLPGQAFAALPFSRGVGQFGNLAGVEQDLGIAAGHLHGQLIDIGVLAAKAGRQRQRHRPGPGIDAAAEQRGELRPGLGDQGNPVTFADPVGDQAAGGGQRVLAQFAERIGALERAARIVEIEPAFALGRIVQRFAECGKVGQAARQEVHVGRWHQGQFGVVHKRGGVGHAR